MNTEQLLSIVIPCYNESEVITETVKRMQAFCESLHNRPQAPRNMEAELIFIDDGSNDDTLALLKDFATKDSKIKIISFARNFGHQIAVTAGTDVAKGDAVVLIDADLQDPPEVIHDMVAKWQEGFDVVYATRTERPGESRSKLAMARTFYRLLNKLSDIPIPLDTGDFRLMSRRVVDTLRAMPERDRFVRGMSSWVGFRQVALPYKRAERFAGTTKYSFRKSLSLATTGIFSFSTVPLQMAIGLGLASAALSLLGIIYALGLRIFTDTWVEGWTAIMIAVLFIGGIQLVSIGILGEYIGRIYNEVKNRPHYIVREYVGFADEQPTLSRSPAVFSKDS
ncbi:MAG: glycosyltransferase family 2 protein [Gammaproteobacteria bacterium]